MSSEKNKKYAISNSLPRIRPPKYPYLAEKIEEILVYFSLTQTQISQMTQIPQASISKCLGRKGSLTGASLSALSTKLPEPIPLWWLMAGPEVGSLHDVLAKEPREEERRKEIRRKEDQLRSAIPPDQQARIRLLQTLRENLQNAMTSVEEELSNLHQTTGGGGIQEDK